MEEKTGKNDKIIMKIVATIHHCQSTVKQRNDCNTTAFMPKVEFTFQCVEVEIVFVSMAVIGHSLKNI